MSSATVPSPPATLDPLLTTWKAGRRIFRVHPKDIAPVAFNPGEGRAGRFHPIFDRRGRPIPTLYAADRIDGALSETVFHGMVAGGVVLRAQLRCLCITELELANDLVLANLTGHGLRRLGLTRSELLECGAAHYSATARWAEALHAADSNLAGLVWVSRQFDTSKALVIFGDRVAQIPLLEVGTPSPLSRGAGFRLVQKAGVEADITIVEG